MDYCNYFPTTKHHEQTNVKWYARKDFIGESETFDLFFSFCSAITTQDTIVASYA